MSIFDVENNLRTDACARDNRDRMNDKTSDYALYQHLFQPCEPHKARSPDFQLDHPNLHLKIGYGFTDDCSVDTDSTLRNNNPGFTRDRCRIQLNSRVFQGVPNMKPGQRDAGREMEIQQGMPGSYLEGTGGMPTRKTISEVRFFEPTPLIPCMADINAPEHVVPPFQWGGEDTRDFMRRQEMLSGSCGFQFAQKQR